jgi:hypothetical protein
LTGALASTTDDLTAWQSAAARSAASCIALLGGSRQGPAFIQNRAGGSLDQLPACVVRLHFDVVRDQPNRIIVELSRYLAARIPYSV